MTNPSPTASLLLSAHEQVRELELVLAGLARQSTRNFDVWVCEDGENPATAELIQSLAPSFPVPLHHLHQENQGFRKAKILNAGLRASAGELLVFLDGDCIPHPNYVEDHLASAAEKSYSAGRRIELGAKLSQKLTAKHIEQGVLDGLSWWLIASRLRGDSQKIHRNLRVKQRWIRKLFGMEKIHDLKGCNYSVSRKALEQINGFDEAYIGYGREDSDVELRLNNAGYRIRSLKGLAIQYHVHHPRRGFTPANDKKIDLVRAQKRIRCEQGLQDLTHLQR